LALQAGTRVGVHIESLPMHIGGAPQAEFDHACADGAVRHPVDDDETAGVAVLPDRRRNAAGEDVETLQ